MVFEAIKNQKVYCLGIFSHYFLKKFHFFGISYFQRAGKIIWTPLDTMTPLSGDPLSGKEDTKKVSSHPTTSCGVQAPFSESYFLIRGGGNSQSLEPKI